MCAARARRPGARLLATACALRGAGALGVRSGARLSHREEPAASSEAAAELGSAAAKAEYAMTWEAAAEKAHSVASAMTPEDQFRLVGGLHNMEAHYYIGNTEAVEKFGIPALRMQDSSNGFRTTDDEEFNTTTHWPSPLALGATWDVDLIERVAEAIGAEFKQKGANVVLGPSLNVHRVAANGRNFEYMAGEDPYLGSRYAAPYIRAVQRQGLIATAKHFAFNEQETNRYNESSDVDAVTAWNLYYPPFEAAVQSGIGAFMCSYNRVNGTFACGNEDILKRDLRDMMGFKGFVMTDWMAGHSPTDMLHGLSQEMTVGPAWFFNKEKLSEFGTTKLTEATAEILTSVYRLGLDREKAPCQQPCTSVKYSNARSAEHTALAREAATASLVLLKNDRGLLPLRAGPKKRLAIVGLPAGAKRGEASWSSRCPDPPQGMSVIGLDPNKQQDYWACLKNSSADYYGGGGSGSVVGPDPVTPAEAIQERAKALGIEVVKYATWDAMDAMDGAESEIADKVDVVLVFAATTSVESLDRSSLHLDDHADRVISTFAALAPTVVCMQTPGAVLTPWRGEVSAIANLFLAGEETAHAWASVLFGDRAPEGKLPIGMPASKTDQILLGKKDSVPYTEGMWTSYRSQKFKWAFPFGHGLSYTTFAYGEPKAVMGGRSGGCGKAVCVRVDVSNTGAVSGREVVQAYLRFPGEGAQFPKMLRGFEKTALLQPGAKAEVSLEFSQRDLSVWRPGEGWVPHKHVLVLIGSSSKDIRCKLNVTVDSSQKHEAASDHDVAGQSGEHATEDAGKAKAEGTGNDELALYTKGHAAASSQAKRVQFHAAKAEGEADDEAEADDDANAGDEAKDGAKAGGKGRSRLALHAKDRSAASSRARHLQGRAKDGAKADGKGHSKLAPHAKDRSAASGRAGHLQAHQGKAAGAGQHRPGADAAARRRDHGAAGGRPAARAAGRERHGKPSARGRSAAKPRARAQRGAAARGRAREE